MAIQLRTDNLQLGQATTTTPSLDPISALPDDILNRIFASLALNELQIFRAGSRTLRDKVMLILDENKLGSMQNFIEELMVALGTEYVNSLVVDGNLKTGFEQRALLERIKRDLPNQSLENLSAWKKSQLEIKNQLIEVLKCLNVEAIKYLEGRFKVLKLRFPHFMADTFPLSKIYHCVDRANLYENQEQKAKALLHTEVGFTGWGDKRFVEPVYELAKLGYIDEACRILETISINGEQDKGREHVCLALQSRGDVEKMLGIAKTFYSADLRFWCFVQVVRILTKDGDVDRISNIAKTISPEDLRALVDHLANIDMFLGALILAQSVTFNDKQKEEIITKIIFRLKNTSDSYLMCRISEYIETISSVEMREAILASFVNVAFYFNDPQEAYRIAEKLRSGASKERVLERIDEELIRLRGRSYISFLTTYMLSRCS